MSNERLVRQPMLKRLRAKTHSEPRPDRISVNGFSDGGLMAQDSFLKALHLEQKRTERSRRRFVLMLLESRSLLIAGDQKGALDKVLRALSQSTRETDTKGWYRAGSVLGVIFTEIAPAEGRSVANALLTKIHAALSTVLSSDQLKRIRLSCHVFPEDWHEPGPGSSVGSTPYPDLLRDSDPRRLALLVKSFMDIVGSLIALTVFSPLFIAIAIAIKLTSKGPILFRQQRVGQGGHKFTFLKFRSMYTANDHAIHEEYVKRLIAGKAGVEQAADQPHSVYKLTNDPRITPVGRLLRRTSLDELPQFLNVLLGEMSLVGPRPPIPYEVDCYDVWHKRRLLAVKPGITGLWQVKGRSKTKFDEMVRLDLMYGRSWSLWLDIKILLQTPRAMLTGDGAY